jgi:hypothetical protein
MLESAMPLILEGLDKGRNALSALTAWHKKAKGDARALVSELKQNFHYLDMVVRDGVPFDDVVEKISLAEFERLNREGFNFDSIKRERIRNYPSLKGSELAAWRGKTTTTLVESIYEKLSILKLRYPFVKDSPKYNWPRRILSVRKRILLLIRHVSEE